MHSQIDRLRSPVDSRRADRDPLDVLRAAFEGSPHGVVVSGEDGTILFVNVPASAIFDYPPGELIGQPLSRLLPEVAAAA